MSNATVLVGSPAGVPNLQFQIGDVATFTDPLGGSPTTRSWTWESFPNSLASGPSFTTPTGASTTVPAWTEYGTYTAVLTRLETDSTTTVQKVLVAVADPLLNACLPSPGFDPTLLLPLSEGSVTEGWAGGTSTAAGDKFLCAWLRAVRNAAITGGENPPTLTYTSFLALTSNGLMTVPSSSGDVVFVPDAYVTPIAGTTIAVFIPAGHTTSVTFAPEWWIIGGTFDASVDCIVFFEYNLFNRYSATVRVFGAHDATAPTITTATVSNGAPDTIVLACSKAVTAKNLMGVSVTGGKTILSMSGKGTTAPSFLVTPAFVGTDTGNIVFAAGQSFQGLNGNPLANVTKAITNNVLSGFASLPGIVGEYDLAAAHVTISSGALAATLKDSSGNGFDIFQASPSQQGDWLTSDSDFGGAPSLNLNKVSCNYAASAITAPTATAWTLHFAVKFPLGSNTGTVWTFAGSGSIAIGVSSAGLFWIVNGGVHNTAYNVSSIGNGFHLVTLTFASGVYTVYVDKVSVGSVSGCGALATGLLNVLGAGSGQELETKATYLVIYDHAQSGGDLASAWAIMKAKRPTLPYS